MSIRGTWSITDCVTDLLAGTSVRCLFKELQSLEETGEEFGFDGKDEYTHHVLVHRLFDSIGNVFGCSRGDP